MKRSILFLLALIIVTGAFAQKKQKGTLPPKVMETAKGIYPVIKDPAYLLGWDKEGANYKIYVPGIKGDQYPSIATIDSTGAFVSTEEFIDASELPAKARAYVTSQDPTAVITEAYYLRERGGKISYRAVVTSKPKFDREGNPIAPKK
jgi:hypothetical protein